MNILMISGSPWFQFRGNHSATYNTLKGVLRQGNKVTLIYPTANYPPELDNAREMMRVSPAGLKVVPVNISPKRIVSLYIKVTSILRYILDRQAENSLVAQFSKYLSYDVNLNIKFINAIGSALEEEKYDLIQVDYPQALKVISFLDRYRIPKVFINHEIQMVRALRTFEAEQEEYKEIIRKIGDVESFFLKKYDAVIVLTEVDSKGLKEFYSIDSYVSPHAIDTDFLKSRQTISEHIRLIYTGGESHYPNRDAIEWFCKDIVPILDRRLKNYKFYITGKWSDETIRRFSSATVVFTGFVEDLRDYLSSVIFVAPIRIGGGMRVKIIEAMAMECGVVSTTVGCEGLGVKDGEHLLIADTAEDFTNKVIELSQNVYLYNTLGTTARKFVVENFSIEVTGKRRVDIYKQIINQHNKTNCTIHNN